MNGLSTVSLMSNGASPGVMATVLALRFAFGCLAVCPGMGGIEKIVFQYIHLKCVRCRPFSDLSQTCAAEKHIL